MELDRGMSSRELLPVPNCEQQQKEPTSCGQRVKRSLASLWRGHRVKREPFSPGENELYYKIDDAPPLLISILLGFQQATLDVSGSLGVAFSIGIMLCAGDDHSAMSKLISTSFVMCGTATIFQTALGSRLPITQGGSSSFLVPIMVLSASPSWRCSADEVPDVCISGNETGAFIKDFGWMDRMRELQGSLMAASLVEVCLGGFGLIGLVVRFFGPLTLCPVVALIGLSLAPLVTSFASLHWGVSIGTVCLVILFSLHLGSVGVPVPRWDRKQGKCTSTPFPVFKLFSIFLAMMLMWLLCYILTITGYLDDTHAHAYPEDANIRILSNQTDDATWFYFPYPGQFGSPKFNLVAFLGFVVGTLVSMIESVGDYHAAAVVCGLPPPPYHAINRGIMMEGSCGMLSGIMGAGHSTTSYSGNIGAISLTRVASRRVFYCAGFLLVVFGISGKIGAALTTIPRPIIGGFLIIGLGLVVGVAFSNLKKVNLDNPRNLAVLGVSLMFGLVIPPWIQQQSRTCGISTGQSWLDQLITAFFGTSMFVGGLTAFILDNTIPGSREDRGMVPLIKEEEASHADSMSEVIEVHSEKNAGIASYDLPFISNWVRRSPFRRLPICPGFSGFSCRKRKTSTANQEKKISC